MQVCGVVCVGSGFSEGQGIVTTGVMASGEGETEGQRRWMEQRGRTHRGEACRLVLGSPTPIRPSIARWTAPSYHQY